MEFLADPQGICRVCRHVFSCKEVRLEHEIRRHSSYFTKKCPFCPQLEYKTLYELASHMQQLHIPLQCSRCRLVLWNARQICVHRAINTLKLYKNRTAMVRSEVAKQTTVKTPTSPQKRRFDETPSFKSPCSHSVYEDEEEWVTAVSKIEITLP